LKGTIIPWYPDNFVGYPDNFVGYPNNFVGYPNNFVGYPNNFVGYPNNFVGYPDNLFLEADLSELWNCNDAVCRRLDAPFCLSVPSGHPE
jgi:hypothetical protein